MYLSVYTDGKIGNDNKTYNSNDVANDDSDGSDTNNN